MLAAALPCLQVPHQTIDVWRKARSKETLDSWARSIRAYSEFNKGSPGFSKFSESNLMSFVMNLKQDRDLAFSTVNRYVGDLIRVWSLLGGSPPSSAGATSLLRSGMVRMSPLPKVVLRTLTASDLLRAWTRMSSSSFVQRRDRCLILLSVLLAARPIDMLSLSRDKDSVVQISDSVVRLRFIVDKSSLLSSKSSKVVTIPWDRLIDLGSVLEAYIQESSLYDVAPSPRIRGKQPLFFCVDKKRFGLPLQSDTVAKIMVRFLRTAGAHSDVSARHLRSVVASSAFELGASLQAVCLHCRWRTTSVFLEHYLRSATEARLDNVPTTGEEGSVVPLVLYSAYQRDILGQCQ